MVEKSIFLPGTAHMAQLFTHSWLILRLSTHTQVTGKGKAESQSQCNFEKKLNLNVLSSQHTVPRKPSWLELFEHFCPVTG